MGSREAIARNIASNFCPIGDEVGGGRVTPLEYKRNLDPKEDPAVYCPLHLVRSALTDPSLKKYKG